MGTGNELIDQMRKRFRTVLEHRVMPGAIDHLQPTARQRGMRGPRMVRRDHRILCSCDDQRRHMADKTRQSVEGAEPSGREGPQRSAVSAGRPGVRAESANAEYFLQCS